MTDRQFITAARQRMVYRYCLGAILCAAILVLRFELPGYVARTAVNVMVAFIILLSILPPHGGLMTLFERDGSRS